MSSVSESTAVPSLGHVPTTLGALWVSGFRFLGCLGLKKDKITVWYTTGAFCLALSMIFFSGS